MSPMMALSAALPEADSAATMEAIARTRVLENIFVGMKQERESVYTLVSV